MAAELPVNPPRRSRGWIWIFVTLVVLTVVAIGVQIWYNAGQQLTAEYLSEAEARWRQHGPRDYDMEYVKKVDRDEETYVVHVRQGKVTEATRNGVALEERLYHYQTMLALFGFIDEFWEIDHKPGSPRVFVVATFDPQDGHLIHYIRSVMSSRQRQEITVQFRGL
jgi:hypothetical protein